jgi:hypothetical protein
MLFNAAWLQQIAAIELEQLFTLLNDKNGGHGCGIALCYDKNTPIIHKGVDAIPDELANIVYGEKDNPDLRYIIYHARMASAAHICDEMCHPFSQETLLGLTLAHNGHTRQFASSNTHSDTAIMYNLITQYGLPLDFLSDQSGVFVGVYQKMPFVIKASSHSELDLVYTPDYSAWCFCSNFYSFRDRFSKRFLLEKHLNTFSWSKRLSAKEVNKMFYDEYGLTWNTKGYSTYKPTTSAGYRNYSTNKSSTYSVVENNRVFKPSEHVGTFVEGYGKIKTRNIEGVVTYHGEECLDWYCDGECLGIQE